MRAAIGAAFRPNPFRFDAMHLPFPAIRVRACRNIRPIMVRAAICELERERERRTAIRSLAWKIPVRRRRGFPVGGGVFQPPISSVHQILFVGS